MRVDPGIWQLPEQPPDLAVDQVHIWRSRLDGAGQDLDAYRQLLSDDERARAQRFVFERDRRRFIVARAVLRTLLAAYTQTAPGDLVFGYGPQGKPFLAQPDDAALAFNLAHSDEWAVYGFTRRGRIGIDIEYQRDLKHMEQLATTAFSARELATWQAVPAKLQPATFYAGWTCKEAFIKALGAGFSFPLNRFEVTFAPTEVPRILHVHGDPAEALRWHLVAFAPAPDVAGAVVMEGLQAAIMFWHFPALPQA